MSHPKHCGLSGKERVYRLRERVARERADEWVSEYLDEDELDLQVSRLIPVNRGHGILTSLTKRREETAGPSQLELALRSVSHVEVPVTSNERESRQNGRGAPHSRQLADSKSDSNKSGSPVTNNVAKLVQSFRPNDAVKRTNHFSFAQFAWGCAIGGAAAAVLLLIVYAVGG